MVEEKDARRSAGNGVLADDVEHPDPGEDVEDIIGNEEDGGVSVPLTYRSTLLKKWRTAPVVKPGAGSHGELGKPVKIPDEMQELMKEKFKENQFNLLASDMISLNRSLTDVRNEK